MIPSVGKFFFAVAVIFVFIWLTGTTDLKNPERWGALAATLGFLTDEWKPWRTRA